MAKPDARPPSSVRQRNRERLLAALRDAGSLPQVELAGATGLSPATVSNLVRELTDEGWVAVSNMVHNGRQARRVRISPRRGFVAGVDLAHRHMRVAIASADYEVLAEDAVALTGTRTLDDDLERADAMIEALLADSGHGRAELVAVGVGVPAPVDPRAVEVRPDGGLPGWREADRAASRIAERLGPSAFLENDANLGLIAETVWGPARNKRDLAYIHVATGIGSGLMIGGRLVHGACGMAGELGHNTVDENGPLCRCGNRGCLDVYATTPALLRLLGDSHGTRLELTDLLRLAGERDHAALRLIEDAGRHIGAATAQLCNLLNPEMVLIGGDLVSAGETLLEPIRTSVRRHTMPGAGTTVEILAATLGERATALGAIVNATRKSRLGATPPLAAVAV